MEGDTITPEAITKENDQLKFELQEIKANYNKLSKAVKEMLDAKAIYMKDTRSYEKQKAVFKKEDEVKNIINPKPKSQATFEWLAQ